MLLKVCAGNELFCLSVNFYREKTEGGREYRGIQYKVCQLTKFWAYIHEEKTYGYTGMVSKIGNMTRRYPKFFPGAAVDEAAQLE